MSTGMNSKSGRCSTSSEQRGGNGGSTSVLTDQASRHQPRHNIDILPLLTDSDLYAVLGGGQDQRPTNARPPTHVTTGLPETNNREEDDQPSSEEENDDTPLWTHSNGTQNKRGVENLEREVTPAFTGQARPMTIGRMLDLSATSPIETWEAALAEKDVLSRRCNLDGSTKFQKTSNDVRPRPFARHGIPGGEFEEREEEDIPFIHPSHGRRPFARH